MGASFIEELGKTDPLASISPLQSGPEGVSPPGEATGAFAAFMQKEGVGASSQMSSGKLAMISPFQLAGGAPSPHQIPSFTTLASQVSQAQGTLGDLNTYLSYPNLKLKSGQKYLLGSKLSDANMNLRAANMKMGADVPNAPSTTQFQGPLGKFLAYLADGQAQLEAAKNQLQNLKTAGGHLSPGDFLLIQVKMNKAQQELDFTSVLLSNAVQGFKMLMQVQL